MHKDEKSLKTERLKLCLQIKDRFVNMSFSKLVIVSSEIVIRKRKKKL